MAAPTRAQVEAALSRLPADQHAGFLAEVRRRMGEAKPAGYRFAETLHTDEQGRTLSFPHMAVPADPEARTYAATAVALPAVWPVLTNPVAAAKAALWGTLGASAGGHAGRAIGHGLEAAGAPKGTADVAGRVGGLAGSLAGGVGGPKAIPALLSHAPGKLGTFVRAARTIAAESGAAAPTAARVAATEAAASAPAASAAASGAAPAAASGATRALLEFAARSGAKAGAKIHLLLDATGAPVRVLTPAEAAVATRAGQATTWVRNVGDPVAAATRRKAAESALQGLGVVPPTP